MIIPYPRYGKVHPRSGKVRCGITLIETLATLSCLLVIAVTAAGTLGVITEIGQKNGDSSQSQRSALRLAERFRQDIRPNSEIQPVANSTGITITKGDRQITYSWDAESHTIHRVARNKQQIASTDRFALAAPCEPRYSVNEEIVTVLIRREPIAWVVEAIR